MASFFGTLSVIVAAGAALVGAVAHLRSPGILPDALYAHGLLPNRWIRAVAVGVSVVEAVLGLAAVVVLVVGSDAGRMTVFGVLTVLFAGYAGYLYRVIATGRSVPCGCSRSDVPVDGWAVIRTASFAVAAALAAALTPIAPLPVHVGPGAVVALAGATVLILLWTLPSAMRQFDSGGLRWTS